jgi:hypothetical protein
MARKRKTKEERGKRRSGNPLGERGRQLAKFEIQESLKKDTQYSVIVEILSTKFQVSKRTVKNWIAEVRNAMREGKEFTNIADAPLPPNAREHWTQLPQADPPLVDPSDGKIGKARVRLADVDAERWEQVCTMMARKAKYELLADELSRKGEPGWSQAENIVINYQKQLSSVLGWNSMPPDRLMSQPEVRAKAIAEMERGAQYMSEREVRRVMKAFSRRLEKIEEEKRAKTESTEAERAAIAQAKEEIEGVL